MLRKKNWLQYVTVSASQIQPNGIKCRSTMLYFGMKQSLYGISSLWSHLCDGSIPPCFALEQERHHPSPDGKILGDANKQWMNEMPQADGKTALGILWPQNACSIETNENYLSKVLQYTVKSWHRHEPHENLNRMWPTVAGTDFKPFARPSFSDICVDAAQILSFSWDAGRAKCSAVRKWPQNLAWKVDELNIKQ